MSSKLLSCWHSYTNFSQPIEVEWESRSHKILKSPKNPVLVVAAIAHLGKLVTSGSRNRCCHAGILTRNMSLFIEVVWESRRRRISMRHRNPLVAGEAIVRLGKLISLGAWNQLLVAFLTRAISLPIEVAWQNRGRRILKRLRIHQVAEAHHAPEGGRKVLVEA